MKSALEIEPGGSLQSEWVVPGDKSISHRGAMLGAIAEGTTILEGFLFSQDCLATLQALTQCGVKIFFQNDSIRIEGKGLNSLSSPHTPIDCQNSGTGLRLLAGLLSGQYFDSVLIGDQSLSKRPMKRIVEPLRQMGADLSGKSFEDENYPPLTIKGKKSLKGITYSMPVASAQVKSCILLAGLYAQSDTVVIENEASRDHTERLMRLFGADLFQAEGKICLKPGRSLLGQKIKIPGDFSSAAFFIAAASFTPGSCLRLRQVGINPTRIGLLAILREMGAQITVHASASEENEPVADLEIAGGDLQGITVSKEWVVSAIDEFPIIFVAAALAEGKTTINGIRELRKKETDRISVMVTALRKLGANIEEWEDGVAIEGGVLSGGIVDAKGDHRIAMALAMAGMRSEQKVTVLDVENIQTSFPGFVEFAKQCGVNIKSINYE